MKRFGNLYARIYDMENLKLAHQNAKKGKGWYKEVKMVDSDPERYLKELQDMLINKYYFRYMDDIVIFGKTKEELHQLRKDIDEYFRMKLKLSVKGNWQVFPTYVRGVDFVGYRIFLNYKLLRKTTCKQMKRKMVSINKHRLEGQSLTYSEWCSINSYKGWLIHCDSFRLQQKYFAPVEKYADAFYQFNIKNKKGGKVT